MDVIEKADDTHELPLKIFDGVSGNCLLYYKGIGKDTVHQFNDFLKKFGYELIDMPDRPQKIETKCPHCGRKG